MSLQLQPAVEPLGLASLVVEGCVVAVGLGGFLATRRRA
jgi:hypothetical protein